MKLSILMPVYNEKQWVARTAERALAQEVPGINDRELVIVDDGSTDGTREILQGLAAKFPQIVLVLAERNQGKGAAIRRAIETMSGDVCIIQDADLEYDPADYPLILEPIIEGRADCVYGSRFSGTQAKRILMFWHYVGNKVLTLMSNAFTNLNLTDMETGYKAFRCDILKTIPLRCNAFGFEPEITAKIARRRCRIFEVGIGYNGRTYADGKKITWLDGVKTVATILKFWMVDDSGKV